MSDEKKEPKVTLITDLSALETITMTTRSFEFTVDKGSSTERRLAIKIRPLTAREVTQLDKLTANIRPPMKKGEKGIRILAPIIGIKRKSDEEAEKDITKQNTRVLVGFRNAYVFDVEQTEGVELPAMREVYGDVGENHDRLVSFIERQGIELVYSEKIAPALGMSYGGRIAILPGQSKAETFATLLHELAHEMLHKAERRTTTTKVVRETEAEAIAFVVGKAVGLEAGTASADYISLYHGNASLLIESLEVIQQTSAVILAALEPSATETMPDAELARVA